MRLSFLRVPSPSDIFSTLSSLMVPLPSLSPGGVFISEDLGKTPLLQADKQKDKKIHMSLFVSH